MYICIDCFKNDRYVVIVHVLQGCCNVDLSSTDPQPRSSLMPNCHVDQPRLVLDCPDLTPETTTLTSISHRFYRLVAICLLPRLRILGERQQAQVYISPIVGQVSLPRFTVTRVYAKPVVLYHHNAWFALPNSSWSTTVVLDSMAEVSVFDRLLCSAAHSAMPSPSLNELAVEEIT